MDGALSGGEERRVHPLTSAMERLDRSLPVSLYVHVPFCAAKCGYCSFYSSPISESALEGWLSSLEKEALFLKSLWGRNIPVRTLYIGGGTPSFLPLSAWLRLLKILEAAADFSPLVEATAEANPSSLTSPLLALWRSAFITRVSLGVQSLNDPELRFLGRLHNAQEALLAMERILEKQLRLSADLIFGLSGQTLRSWAFSLRGILSAGAEHISAYQLTLEPDTPLGSLSPQLPDGYPFYRYAQWFLPKKGLQQYEISNFALEGAESLHNLAYWRQENVLALGPSAWGYIEGQRYSNPRTLENYEAYAEGGFSGSLPVLERLSERGRGIEAAILALRTSLGIDRDVFSRRWGAEMMDQVAGIMRALPAYLIRDEGSRLALTSRGMRVGNAIWAELLELAAENGRA